MPRIAAKLVRVSATEFRDHFKEYAGKAKGDKVILVENRRLEPKCLVDKKWLDTLIRDVESTKATVEILADRQLTERLLTLSKTIDEDVTAGKLHTMEEVFGEE